MTSASFLCIALTLLPPLDPLPLLLPDLLPPDEEVLLPDLLPPDEEVLLPDLLPPDEEDPLLRLPPDDDEEEEGPEALRLRSLRLPVSWVRKKPSPPSGTGVGGDEAL